MKKLVFRHGLLENQCVLLSFMFCMAVGLFQEVNLEAVVNSELLNFVRRQCHDSRACRVQYKSCLIAHLGYTSCHLAVSDYLNVYHSGPGRA